MKVKLSDFQEILIEITGGEKPLCPLKEVAFVMGCDYQTAWGYRAGHTEPKWKDAVRLSHHLIKEYGYYNLGMQPTLVCISGRANGKVNDDLLSLFEFGTDLHKAFNANNPTAFWNAFNRMKEEMKDLEAEGMKL